MNTEYKKLSEIEYLIDYPRDYKDGERRPVIILMNGAGTRGCDIDKIIPNSLYFKSTAEFDDFPFITVVPRCPADRTWFDYFETIKAIVNEVVEADFTDKKRIYLMGVSMGGYAAWQLGMSMPRVFAAIVPICGGGMYWNASRLKNTPVWAFHGKLDTTVFPEESEKMVNAVIKKGGEARLTIYPENAHDAWSPTFANKEVFDWLLSKTNNDEELARDSSHDGAKFG